MKGRSLRYSCTFTLLVVGLGALVIFALMKAWLRQQYSTLEHPRYPLMAVIYPDLKHISRVTNIKFPPTTRLLESNYVGLPCETFLHAKLELHPAEVEVFLESLPSPKTIYTEETIPPEWKEYLLDGAAGTESLSWWDVDSSKKYIAIIAAPEHVCGMYSIVINQDDPLQSVIYFERHIY